MVKITITKEHLEKAKSFVSDIPSQRCSSCVISQAASEVLGLCSTCSAGIYTYSSVEDRYFFSNPIDVFALPRKVRDIMHSFDVGRYDEIEKILPFTFETDKKIK